MMKHRLATTIALGLFLTPNPVIPCECMGPPGLEESVELAAEIFSGTVIEVRPAQFDYWGDWGQYEVLIDVEACWKGTCEDTLTIGTLEPGGLCGIEFQVGQEYLFYAYLQIETGVSWAWECTRTTLLAFADYDLEYLGEPIFVPTVPVTWGRLKGLFTQSVPPN